MSSVQRVEMTRLIILLQCGHLLLQSVFIGSGGLHQFKELENMAGKGHMGHDGMTSRRPAIGLSPPFIKGGLDACLVHADLKWRLLAVRLGLSMTFQSVPVTT